MNLEAGCRGVSLELTGGVGGFISGSILPDGRCRDQDYRRDIQRSQPADGERSEDASHCVTDTREYLRRTRPFTRGAAHPDGAAGVGPLRRLWLHGVRGFEPRREGGDLCRFQPRRGAADTKQRKHAGRHRALSRDELQGFTGVARAQVFARSF